MLLVAASLSAETTAPAAVGGLMDSGNTLEGAIAACPAAITILCDNSRFETMVATGIPIACVLLPATDTPAVTVPWETTDGFTAFLGFLARRRFPEGSGKASGAALSSLDRLFRCTEQKSVPHFALVLHPTNLHRLPPPCLMQKSVRPCALFVHP